MERLTSVARNVIAILLALNPVSVCQMFSFMVDGMLSSLILILISQFLILLREPVRLHFFASGLSVVLLINVKYSGLPYALFLACAYSACVLFQDRSLTRRASIFLASAIFIGVFAFGYNPYVTNTIETGNPFHRVIGQGATNTVDGHVEAGFLQKTRFEKFFLSVLSRSMNSLQDPPELKIPLTISTGEIIPFFTPDTRIGGWGPFFGGALLLAAAILLLAAFRPPRYFRLALLATLLTFGAIFVFPEPWWARYAPHAWILPFIPVVMCYYPWGFCGNPAPCRPDILVRQYSLCDGDLCRGRDVGLPVSPQASVHPGLHE